MPMYDYLCSKCSHKFESYHPLIDDEPEKCVLCGSDAERVQHFHDQKLKRPDYIPPPKAYRRFGDERPTPHRRKRWV